MNTKINLAFCLCVRNCEKHLTNIFKNIDLFNDKYNLYTIIVYDNCKDNSEKLIKKYQTKNVDKVYISKIENTSPFRTVRIAKARNECLDIVYSKIKNIDFHIMLDTDNVNDKVWNIDLINKYLNNFDKDNWDAISFNRGRYYDIWALLYDDFKHHCWGYKEKRNSIKVVDYMKKDITNKLNNLKNTSQNSIRCLSAFNGFSIYKTPKFKGILYDGIYENIKKLISDNERQKTLNFVRTKIDKNLMIDESKIEHCEHLFYHLAAIKKNNCIIKISKFCI
jgi:hypothetical protein